VVGSVSVVSWSAIVWKFDGYTQPLPWAMPVGVQAGRQLVSGSGQSFVVSGVGGWPLISSS
jgi:hypothetical protein